MTPEPPVVAIEPNEHGVYPEGAGERFELPNPRKGWRGCPWAEINLLHLAQGWIQSSGVWLSQGGYGQPLTTRTVYPSRAAAMEAARSRVADRAAGDDSVAGRAILAWLDTLS